MSIERIKKVKLLVTLKGTDNEGKQIKWLEGTVFDKSKKPFPLNIINELQSPRVVPIFEVLEAEPEEKLIVEEEPKEEQESTEEVPPEPKTRIKIRRK